MPPKWPLNSSRMSQAVEHCRISRVYRGRIGTDRAAAGVAPTGTKSRAGAARLSLHTIIGESCAVPGQGQSAATDGRSKDWRTYRPAARIMKLDGSATDNQNVVVGVCRNKAGHPIQDRCAGNTARRGKSII